MKRFFCKLVKDFKPAYRALWLTLRGRRGKSPVNKDRERRAGDYTMRELLLRLGVAIFLVGMVVGGIITAYSLTKFALIAVLVSLPLLLACAPLLPVLWYQAENYFLGHVGERIVGDALAKVAAHPQWRVFHGFDIGFGDIDHIIVCPKGVFCVETKMLRKSPEKVDNTVTFKDGKLLRRGRELPRNPIPQASGNALKLRDYLNSQGADIDWVCAIIALPGQYVTLESPVDEKGPCPCNPKQMSSFINREREGEELSNEQINKICEVLEEKNTLN